MFDAKKLNLEMLQQQHADICMDLNIESDIQLRSWQIYLETSEHLLSEGDPMHWLCCSLYIAWQTYQPPSPGDQVNILEFSHFLSPPFENNVHPGVTATTQDPKMSAIRNGMNLNYLLRICGLSINNFINKLKYWNCNSSEQNVQSQILKLERKFCLNLLLFNNYKDMFKEIYQLPPNGIISTQVQSLNKKYDCQNLFDMGWMLFLCAKHEIPKISLDFVHLHNLLICCVELLYRNVLHNQRFDLINMEFKGGVPEDWLNGNFDASIPQDYCVIQALCQITSAYAEEVYKMKYGKFREVMDKLLGTYMIYGFRKTYLGLTADLTFWLNFKTLNRSYEKYMMTVCEFDERVLPNYALIPRDTNMTIGGITTKEHMIQKESLKQTYLDVFDKTLFNVKRLQSVTDLKESLRVALMNNTPKEVTIMLNAMRDQFCAAYVTDIKETIQRFNLAQSLYYYFLTKILLGEKTHKPNLSLTSLFKQPIFNSSLMACCLELVLKAYNTTTQKFPWILKCCNIEALNFYKILEIVVRHHDDILTRSLIRHLRTIEEMCLETLVWREASILWPLVKDIDTSLPSYYDVKENVASKRNPLQKCGNTQSTINDNTKEIVPRHNLKSFHLFLRKLYHLAWERLDKLCSCLRLKDNNDMLNIWLIFQYSITHEPLLMLERHLDQLIICSIYIYVRKNCIRNIQFADIIKYYRFQRQAHSNNYRKVLLKRDKKAPIYSDIIAFYNHNYLPVMGHFVSNQITQFGLNTVLETPEDLKIAAHINRVSPHHHLYISSLIKSKIKDVNYKFRERHLQDLDALENCYRCRTRPNILKRLKDTTSKRRNSMKQKKKILDDNHKTP